MLRALICEGRKESGDQGALYDRLRATKDALHVAVRTCLPAVRSGRNGFEGLFLLQNRVLGADCH